MSLRENIQFYPGVDIDQYKEVITLVDRDALVQRFVCAIHPFRRDSQNKPGFEPLELEQFDEQPNDDYYSTGLLDNLFLGVEIDSLG